MQKWSNNWTYASDEAIAESDVSRNKFLKGDRLSPPEYAQEICIKSLQCGTVYDEARLEGIFIEGLQE